jgi:hypothetical protein
MGVLVASVAVLVVVVATAMIVGRAVASARHAGQPVTVRGLVRSMTTAHVEVEEAWAVPLHRAEAMARLRHTLEGMGGTVDAPESDVLDAVTTTRSDPFLGPAGIRWRIWMDGDEGSTVIRVTAQDTSDWRLKPGSQPGYKRTIEKAVGELHAAVNPGGGGS